MTSKRTPAVPDALALADALARNATLSGLRDRIRDSNARLAAILDVLPGALTVYIAAGPVDEEGWTLFVPNASIATKLRQLLPRIEQRLLQRGWTAGAVRIRIQPLSQNHTVTLCVNGRSNGTL